MRSFNVFISIALLAGSLFAAQNKVVPARASRAIAAARQKILDGDRVAALQILKAALLNEKDPARMTRLQNEVTHLSELFLTNDGQKKFELAESDRHSGGPDYLSIYDDALKLEPGNTRIMAGYVLGLIAKKECRKALDEAAEIQESDPNMPELRYLTFRAQLCADPSALTTKNDLALDADKFSAIYRKVARSEEEFDRGDVQSALEFARAAIKIDDKFPESYYWAYKAEQADGRGVDDAQRFLYLCKGLSAQTRRRYNYEPMLCTQVDEAEQYVQNAEAQKHEGA